MKAFSTGATTRIAENSGVIILPLAAGPRSLAGHLEYLEWAATEVMPIFRPSVV